MVQKIGNFQIHNTKLGNFLNYSTKICKFTDSELGLYRISGNWILSGQIWQFAGYLDNPDLFFFVGLSGQIIQHSRIIWQLHIVLNFLISHHVSFLLISKNSSFKQISYNKINEFFSNYHKTMPSTLNCFLNSNKFWRLWIFFTAVNILYI